MGNEYCLGEHSSLQINPYKNKWYWFSKNKGGNIIEFLVEYENRTVIEAVKILSGRVGYEPRQYTKYEPIKTDEKGDLQLPDKAESNKRVWSYLTKTRGIDSDIVNELLKENYIYEATSTMLFF